MNSIALLSHTSFSHNLMPAGLGESVHAQKLYRLLSMRLFNLYPIADIYETFAKEGVLERFQNLAHTNLQLAEHEQDLLEDCPNIRLKHIPFEPKTIVFWLSWAVNISGLYASGLHLKFPTVVKLYVFHPNEKVLTALYQPASLLITECLLANIKGAQYGISPSKMIYLPHHYPLEVESMRELSKEVIKKQYVHELGLLNHKKINLTEKTLVIGNVCRLQYRKNVEYALQALKKFHERNPDRSFYFILKGQLDQTGEWVSSYSYHDWLKNEIEQYQKEPWFLWDQSFTPYLESLRKYCAFDCAIHLSGAEGASNIVVDYLALGIPTLILDASTNPYLFKSGALFVKSGPMRPGPLPFNTPDEEDLYLQLEKLILDESVRKNLRIKALEIAKLRFHPQKTIDRIPLILDAARNPNKKSIQNKIVERLTQDLNDYQVSH